MLGKFQDDAAHVDEDCEDVTKCGADEFQVTAATSSSDAVCSSCEGENSFNNPVTKECEDVTECQPGTYQTAAPTVTSDRVCKVCLNCLSDSCAWQ